MIRPVSLVQAELPTDIWNSCGDFIYSIHYFPVSLNKKPLVADSNKYAGLMFVRFFRSIFGVPYPVVQNRFLSTVVIIHLKVTR